jgi:tripartite-type tricarboxylate transporter receptor subunit TctC
VDRFLRLVAAVLLGSTGTPVLAQADAARAFPDRPVRIVVPFGAAGGTTAVARVIAAKASESIGQSVIVEPKPGAQGIVAAEFVRKAAPDGYTILIGTVGPIAVNPAIYPNLPYQPLRDFTPVTLIGTYPLLLVVNASLPARSVQELIDHAKARPDRINYGATGAISQLMSEHFNQLAGTRFVHIPYKSSGDFVTAVLANEVTMVFSDIPPLAGHVQAGKLRALAITSTGRHRAWPDVPTMAEAGVPGFVFELWNGFLVPSGTPGPVVGKLHAEFARVIALPDTRERLEGLGIDPVGVAGEEFGKIIAADIARFGTVARTANVKAE